MQTGSERSLLIKLQFATGSLAVGAVYFPTGVPAANARSGIGECDITHFSGKVMENPNVLGRRLGWPHWE